jgi:hypothetical protein
MFPFIEFAFSSFWVWVGCWFVFYFSAELVLKCWSRFMRLLMVRKHGWPPPHLDADGDWMPSDDEGSESCGCDQCKTVDLIRRLSECRSIADHVGADAAWDEIENAGLQTRRALLAMEHDHVCPNRKQQPQG